MTSAELVKVSDGDLHAQTVLLARKEQQITLELLVHLHEVERRKLYAERGFASLWEYVQKALSYSETQTAERISAMRLMFRDDSVKKALERGTITLTQAAMAERHLRAEEKETRIPVSKEVVKDLIVEITGQSKRETEKILLSHKPVEETIPEKIRTVSPTISELKFPISEETRKAMERFWELKGKGSVSEMFETCLQFYLEQKDPQKQEVRKVVSKGTLPAKLKPRSRYVSVSVKQNVQRRSEGQCEYVDSETNRRCQSRYLLQYDHIEPYAFGGMSDLSNIRHLCAVHNGYLAEKMFAREAPALYGGFDA